MKAVLLAGGPRKHPLSQEMPHSLTAVAGKTIIEWQMEWLRKYKIASLLVLAGNHGEKIAEFLGTGRKYGISTAFQFEEEPLGTGGSIKNAYDMLAHDEMFLAMNDNVITDMDIFKMKLDHADVANIAIVPLRTTYGVVTTDGNKITHFANRPTLRDYWLNSGIYLMSRRLFSYLPDVGDFEVITFPKLAKENKLSCTHAEDAYWHAIRTEYDVAEATRELGRKLKA